MSSLFDGGADPTEWNVLTQYMEPRRFSPGETLLVGGEPDRSLYVLTEGTVEAIVPRKNGSKHITTIEAMSLFGEVAFFDGGVRSATVRGVTHGELLRLGFAQFETLAGDHPALGRAVLLDLGVRVAARLRSVEQSHD